MTLSPFKPVGEVARWRTIYALLVPLGINDVLTYEEMAKALDLDSVDDRHVIQANIARAARELEEVNKHSVKPVKNVGYRIVEPMEHIDLAKDDQKKSGRSLKRAYSHAVNVDLSDSDPEVRKGLQILAIGISEQREVSRRIIQRQNRMEHDLETIFEKSTKTEEEVAALQERLQRLEEKDGGDIDNS